MIPASVRPPICGRCRVYKHLHPRANCPRPTTNWWWVEHSASRHVKAWVWLRLSSRTRWQVIGWVHDRRPDLCWCDLVDSAVRAGGEYRADYAGEWGCLCDVLLPTDAGPPRPGHCYCEPSATPTERTSDEQASRR